MTLSMKIRITLSMNKLPVFEAMDADAQPRNLALQKGDSVVFLRAFKCLAVYLSRESAQHILNDHSDIDTFQLLLLPIAIQKGQLLRETRRPQFINSLYKESDEKNYFVAMKTARNGHELWVSSMYRVEARQIDVNGGDKTSAIMLLRESFHRTLDINRWLQICDNAF
jgi:hypothetical protein